MKVSFLCMTGFDGPAPGIDVWPAPPKYCEPGMATRSMNRWIDQSVRAEELGFDWISCSEHHYAPYQLTPNPMIMASALVQRTKRAKIALLGPLVPLNNPVRLAEEIAMLDTLSGGRMVVLFLRGTPNEHGTYDTPVGATRGMTQEGIDLALKAWREDEPFSWHSEHYDFSTVAIWPRVQKHSDPMVYGSGNSAESVVFAAQRRIGIAFSFAYPHDIKTWIDLYKMECDKAGWEPTPEHIIYRGLVNIAETDQKARDHLNAVFGAKAAEQAQITQKTMGGPPMLPLILEPYFMGSPKTLLERYEVLREVGVGVTDTVFVTGAPEAQHAQLELFGAEVLPVVQSWSNAFVPELAAVAD